MRSRLFIKSRCNWHRLTDINHNNTVAKQERRHHEIRVPAICRLAFEPRKEESGEEEDFEHGENDSHTRNLSSSILGQESRPGEFGLLRANHTCHMIFPLHHRKKGGFAKPPENLAIISFQNKYFEKCAPGVGIYAKQIKHDMACPNYRNERQWTFRPLSVKRWREPVGAASMGVTENVKDLQYRSTPTFDKAKCLRGVVAKEHAVPEKGRSSP